MLDKDTPSVPTSPSPNLDPISSLSPATQLCIKRLQDLFSEREIATRRAIYNTYLSKHGPGRLDERENWRPILRFALPYVCYMWKSGPFRDGYVVFGLDPRRERRWAGYQTATFSFRDSKEVGKKLGGKEEEGKKLGGQEEEGKSHLFTGQEVGTRNVSYCLKDVVDPMLRKILDDAVLRDKFHVLSPESWLCAVP
jgi:general transcription factor 3C polypeptide 5 (transcription factor C subunit 1)